MLSGLWDWCGMDGNRDLCMDHCCNVLGSRINRLYAEIVVIVKHKLLIFSIGLLNTGRFSHTHLYTSRR